MPDGDLDDDGRRTDPSRRRAVLVGTTAVLLLGLADSVEFGLEVRIPWLAVLGWLLAAGAIIVMVAVASGSGGTPPG